MARTGHAVVQKHGLAAIGRDVKRPEAQWRCREGLGLQPPPTCSAGSWGSQRSLKAASPASAVFIQVITTWPEAPLAAPPRRPSRGNSPASHSPPRAVPGNPKVWQLGLDHLLQPPANPQPPPPPPAQRRCRLESTP